MTRFLSHSKIELFLQCPRCFRLDVVAGVKRPLRASLTIRCSVAGTKVT